MRGGAAPPRYGPPGPSLTARGGPERPLLLSDWLQPASARRGLAALFPGRRCAPPLLSLLLLWPLIGHRSSGGDWRGRAARRSNWSGPGRGRCQRLGARRGGGGGSRGGGTGPGRGVPGATVPAGPPGVAAPPPVATGGLRPRRDVAGVGAHPPRGSLGPGAAGSGEPGRAGPCAAAARAGAGAGVAQPGSLPRPGRGAGAGLGS